MKQTVRIIGGRFRGKKIHFPAQEGLRPTPDRVRETLFNWLMHDIQGATCLDAFAGSGALGIEAWSRGAERVTFLEANPLVYEQLLKTTASFHDPALQVIKTDTLRYLEQTTSTFNLVFLDPPFHENQLPTCIRLLETKPVLPPGGLLYIESAAPCNLTTPYWEVWKAKTAGQVNYALYKKIR